MEPDFYLKPKSRPSIKTCQLLVGFTIGGVERQLLRVLPRVARSGYEISVCSLKGSGPLISEFQALGFPTSCLEGKGKWDPRVVIRLYRRLRRERPVILHSYTTLANWAGAAAGRAAGIPIIVMSDRDIRTWLTSWQVVAEKYAFKLANCMTMPSEAIKRFDIERLGHSAQKLVVVPNGVDVEVASNEGLPEVSIEVAFGRQNPLRIGYVGRIAEPLKGVEVLLRALYLLKERGLEYEAILVGDGRDRGRMERLSYALGLEGRIAFLGERSDVRSLMQSLDLLVVPSLSEGCPNVVLEAMALGIAVVATDVGGTPEIIKHGVTGWLVRPGDPVALAHAVARRLIEPRETKEVALQARAWVTRHRSAEVAGEALVGLYEYLLGQVHKRKGHLAGDDPGYRRQSHP